MNPRVLLLLPVLYVGSYLALVTPSGPWVLAYTSVQNEMKGERYIAQQQYRWGGYRSGLVFWPLEQIDRRVRPKAWEEKAFGQLGPLDKQP